MGYRVMREVHTEERTHVEQVLMWCDPQEHDGQEETTATFRTEDEAVDFARTVKPGSCEEIVVWEVPMKIYP